MAPLIVLETCPDCDAPLRLRLNGRTDDLFIGCAAYPGCSFTEQYYEREQRLLQRIDELEAAFPPAPQVKPIGRDRLRHLISQFHPDHHGGHPLATAITSELTRLRDEVAA